MVGHPLMNGADQMGAAGVFQLEAEVSLGIRLRAAGFLHALAEAEENDVVASRRLIGCAVLDVSSKSLG